MKAKLEGFLNPGVAIVKYKENDKGFPARYARAIAYYQMKEPDRAPEDPRRPDRREPPTIPTSGSSRARSCSNSTASRRPRSRNAARWR
jgi:predicted Zn-dependent protease